MEIVTRMEKVVSERRIEGERRREITREDDDEGKEREWMKGRWRERGRKKGKRREKLVNEGRRRKRKKMERGRERATEIEGVRGRWRRGGTEWEREKE